MACIPFYHGDEAVINTAAFRLEGRSMRTIRQAAHRLERHGFHAEIVTAGDVPPALRAELAAVEPRLAARRDPQGLHHGAR